MKFDQEFKDAILNLPEKDKDKLLLRLLKKEELLVNQLYFQLIETRPIEEIRNQLSLTILNILDKSINRFYSPGYLLIELKTISGLITKHIKETKDKTAEISLNLLMLNHTLNEAKYKISKFNYSRNQTLFDYIINRTFKILLQIHKK